MKRKLMERASKEMLPNFNDTEAIWKNDKDIIGRLFISKEKAPAFVMKADALSLCSVLRWLDKSKKLSETQFPTFT